MNNLQPSKITKKKNNYVIKVDYNLSYGVEYKVIYLFFEFKEKKYAENESNKLKELKTYEEKLEYIKSYDCIELDRLFSKYENQLDEYNIRYEISFNPNFEPSEVIKIQI